MWVFVSIHMLVLYLGVNTFNCSLNIMTGYLFACHWGYIALCLSACKSASKYAKMYYVSKHQYWYHKLTFLCVSVCVCGQRVAAAAASAGVWYAEGPDPGAVLFHDALRWLLHDVPPDQGTVCHQTLHHLQHVGGTSKCIQHRFRHLHNIKAIYWCIFKYSICTKCNRIIVLNNYM